MKRHRLGPALLCAETPYELGYPSGASAPGWLSMTCLKAETVVGSALLTSKAAPSVGLEVLMASLAADCSPNERKSLEDSVPQ